MFHLPGACCVLMGLFLKTTAASGDALVDWPVAPPIRVLNTISTLQFYGPRPGFHHGLDLEAPADTEVFSPVSGKVAARHYYKRATPYTYEVSVETDEGLRWEFHHISEDSVPAEVRRLAETGDRIERGQMIARVYDAAQLGISPHVHVNVIDSDGFYLNPLGFFPPLNDQQPPRIAGIYIVTDKGNVVAEASTLGASIDICPGSYEVIVEALDFIPPSRVGQSIYRMQVDSESEGQPPTPIGSFRFDRLPHKGFLEGADKVFQLTPITWQDGRTLAVQVAPEKPRVFLYRFPLDYRGGNASLRVRAVDFAGNKAVFQVSMRPAMRPKAD